MIHKMIAFCANLSSRPCLSSITLPSIALNERPGNNFVLGAIKASDWDLLQDQYDIVFEH